MDFDLKSVLDHYEINFRDKSGEQSIKCPAHEERRASCALNLDKGLWTCFSCGAKGDALTLIQIREEVGYETSLEIYKKITGASDSDLRSSDPRGSGNSSRVPPGSGYKPRVHKRLPTGIRQRPDFGS